LRITSTGQAENADCHPFFPGGDIDGDKAEEVIADFGTLGLWLWNGGVWSQISANNPD
jgi:hypothetical protein